MNQPTIANDGPPMTTRSHSWRFFFLPVLAAFVFSLVSLKLLPGPFVWSAAAWVAVSVLGMAADKKRKALWFNFGVLVAALGFCEGYLWYQGTAPKSDFRSPYPQGYTVPHEVLGYAPAKNFRVESARRTIGDQLVYDVPYTIGADGLRIGPATTGDSVADCVLCFGGSLTFGEGVRDDETMPHLVGSQTRGSFRVYNFGFHGYGPHHMLAALEYEMEREVLDCRPRYVIYQAIPDHVMRVAHLFSWARRGPKYVLSGDNGIVRIIKKPLIDKILRQFRKSRLLEQLFFQRSVTDEDIELFVRVVDKSRELLQDRYPGCEFHVIYWDNDYMSLVMAESARTETLNRLRSRGIRVHLISDILPDASDVSKYALHPMDLHPTPLAHQMISEYVLENILKL